METKVTFHILSQVPASKWQELSLKRIYFAHQSVGFNIIDGIKDLMKKYPQIRLNIIETTDFDKTAGGAFFHSPIGKNTDPDSKMREFEKLLTSEQADKIDIAFLKFCYVDITADSKPYEIFASYIETLKRIRAKNHHTNLIHFTDPLRVNQSGLKAFIKNLFGKSIWGQADNAKRFQYNQLISSTFASKEPVFDIAQIESTKLDGNRTTFKLNGHTYFQLTPEYSNDGGHLNELGRKIVAEKLLLLLVNQI